MLGTIGGAALATAIVIVQSRLPYPRLTLAMLVLLFVWLSYTFLFVNYGVFAVWLTSYVIFILSLAGLPERSLVNHRVMGTLIGGSLVIASDVIWLAIATVRIRSAKTSRLAE
jgi:uncharacterized membrane protein YccC